MPTIHQLNKVPNPKDRVKMKIIRGPKAWQGSIYLSPTAIPTLPFFWNNKRWVIDRHPDSLVDDSDILLMMVQHGEV